jgi:hypothetical protein
MTRRRGPHRITAHKRRLCSTRPLQCRLPPAVPLKMASAAARETVTEVAATREAVTEMVMKPAEPTPKEEKRRIAKTGRVWVIRVVALIVVVAGIAKVPRGKQRP